MCPSRAAARTGSRSRSTGSRRPRCPSRWRSCHPDRGPRSGEARRPPAARSRGGRRARLEPERLPPARSRRRAERRGGARDGGDERLPRPHLDGLPYLDKPVLYFAAAAALMELLGSTETAAPLPAYFFALATLAPRGVDGWRRS